MTFLLYKLNGPALFVPGIMTLNVPELCLEFIYISYVGIPPVFDIHLIVFSFFKRIFIEISIRFGNQMLWHSAIGSAAHVQVYFCKQNSNFCEYNIFLNENISK